MICSFGLSGELYRDSLQWLDENPQRRISFVEDRQVAPDAALLRDPRVKIHWIESPLQIEKVAAHIAWESVFLPLQIVVNSPSPLFSRFEEVLKQEHAAANLQLNDAADFGCSLLKNAKSNLSRPFRSILNLKNAFQNIPAILIGAGPSLEKNIHSLKNFTSKAILFAAGHALEKSLVTPHFGVLIDKAKPLSSVCSENIPLFFQARMHPDNFSLCKGEAFLVPDSHFPFLNFLSGDRDLFESGWTVGNFSAALAVFLGCNPVICIGMDYCYQNERKYAFEGAHPTEGLVFAKDGRGDFVLTQMDWLMAISWMEDFAKRHPSTTFFNATEGGMGYLTPCKLDPLALQDIPDLQKTIDRALAKTNIVSCPKWPVWEDVLRDESFQEEFFLPLWQLWKPIFARELDPYPISFEDKMRIHKTLFFNQVAKEYLDALR